MRMHRSFFLRSLIHLVVGLAEIILLLRIVLRLFSANPTASFVHWVYQTSGTLLQPFRGVFPSAVISKGYVLDFTALFALIVYLIAGLILVYIVSFFEAGIKNARSKK